MSDKLYAIVEVDNGLTIIEYGVDEDIESVTQANQGILVDAGPYHSYEEAYEQMLNLEPDHESERLD